MRDDCIYYTGPRPTDSIYYTGQQHPDSIYRRDDNAPAPAQSRQKEGE